MTAIAIIERDQIIKRVSAGEYLATIADDLGVSPAAISKVISNDPDYQIARESGIERRLTMREAELQAADDPVNLARARELLSHQRWRAEREFPARWGQRAQIEVTVDIGQELAQIAQSMRNAAPHTIDNQHVEQIEDAQVIDK